MGGIKNTTPILASQFNALKSFWKSPVRMTPKAQCR